MGRLPPALGVIGLCQVDEMARATAVGGTHSGSALVSHGRSPGCCGRGTRFDLRGRGHRDTPRDPVALRTVVPAVHRGTVRVNGLAGQRTVCPTWTVL